MLLTLPFLFFPGSATGGGIWGRGNLNTPLNEDNMKIHQLNKKSSQKQDSGVSQPFSKLAIWKTGF